MSGPSDDNSTTSYPPCDMELRAAAIMLASFSQRTRIFPNPFTFSPAVFPPQTKSSNDYRSNSSSPSAVPSSNADDDDFTDYASDSGASSEVPVSRRNTRSQAKGSTVKIDKERKKWDSRSNRNRKGKGNKTREERIALFKAEELIGGLEPHSAWCLECQGWVALDKRREYYYGMWDKHLKFYHTPGGRGYEHVRKHVVMTGQRPSLFRPKRPG